LQKLNDWRTSHPAANQYARIEVTVLATVPFEGVILIGLFAKPIPEGLPLYGTVLSSEGDFCFTGVKPGIYYLMATTISWGMQAMDILLPQTTLRTRSREPIIVGTHSIVPHQQVTLHVPRPDDPPILISLPLLMSNFLKKVRQNTNR
jgi:AraC family transcriptional regulator